MTWLNKPSAVKQAKRDDPDNERLDANDVSSLGGVIQDTAHNSPLLETSQSNQNARQVSQRNKVHDLPPNVTFHPPSKDDMPAFKRLNQTLLPVPYPSKFYSETIEDATIRSVTLFAFWNDRPVTTALQSNGERGTMIGAVRCKILDPQVLAANGELPRKDAPPVLYISTLAVLPPYQGYGIAGKMLKLVGNTALKEHRCDSVGAHVWEANEEGLRWYDRRGFIVRRKEEGYYRRFKRQGAFVLERELRDVVK